MMNDLEDDFPGKPELSCSIALSIIENLKRVRDLLGYELAAAYQEQSAEEFDDTLKETGLIRNRMSEKEILRNVDIFIKLFPQLEWDSELIADALFVEYSDVQNAMSYSSK